MKNMPFLLIINDGWGVAPQARSNAIAIAHTPVFNHLIQNYWVETLQASGDAVGLPWGEMGNSEVGHTSLGSGKIMYQHLPRITRAIEDETFFSNKEILAAIEKVQRTGGVLHIAGLVSDGGVHSHIEHLYALLELAGAKKIQSIMLHCFLDGRDVLRVSACGFIEDLEEKIKIFHAHARIATISGRYFAMDRDNRWNRTKAAYRAMVLGEADKKFNSAIEAIAYYYEQEIYDEQIPPTVIEPSVAIGDKDALIFFNFRGDRMRQLASSFIEEQFDTFDRGVFLKDLHILTMTEYDENVPTHVAFPPERITMPLARVLADAGLKQLHIAETEKYAHVTYFFNGGVETAFAGEQRILVPSPSVGDYATVPEMSAREITNRLLHEIETGQHHFLVVNFANADMVGHTGEFKPTVKAIEVLDGCFKILTEAILKRSGTVMITADHGNAEIMFDSQTGEIVKEHTSNPIPCIIVGKNFVQEKPQVPDLSMYTPRGVLADIAPTILTIMGVPIQSEMTGRSLV